MFEIAEELEDTYLDEKVIKPMNSSSAVVLPETSPTHIEYRYALGRGVGVMDNIRRRLEDGVLPIYHSEMTDDDIVYRSTSFVSLAGTPLNERTVRGTHYLISDRHSAGRVFTDEQSKQLEQVQRQDTAAKPLVALYIRTIAENTGSVPRYAWFKAPRPSAAYRFDGGRGYTGFSENRISCISKVDGKALHEEETAILLQPGQRIEIDFLIPHEPVSAETADALTPSDGNNWMLLLIDADNDSSTGWYGYDFVINKKVKDGRTTTLMRYDSDSEQWIEAAELPYRYEGNRLEVIVPRKLLGLTGDGFTFDFKWSDNAYELEDPISLCLHGDTAPNRRFNYRCIWNRR